MKQNRQRRRHKVFPFFLCFCMLFTMPGIQNVFPVVAAAEQEDTGESGDLEENSDTETGEEQNTQPEEDGETGETDELTETNDEGAAISENDEGSERESVSSEGQEETVTVENSTDAIIQILLDRMAALLDVEKYLATEPDMEDGEAYAEWEEKLYEYTEEALAIWKEYENLTEEQQAQIPEEELAKLTAWVEIAETLSDQAVMLAENSEHHGESDWQALTAGDTTLSKGKFYLSDENGDLTMGTITIDGDVTLCLNGHTLEHDSSTDGSVIVVNSGTFTLCDCQDDYTYSWNGSKENPVYTLGGSGGCITGGNGYNLQGGGVYVGPDAVFKMNSGRITGCDVGDGTGHCGGGVYVETDATFEMTGGFIENNAAGIGGGVDVKGCFIMSDEAVIMNNVCGVNLDSESGAFTMKGGKILGNTVQGLGGGVKGYTGATIIIEGGLIEGNSATSGGAGLFITSNSTAVLSGGTIRYNRMPADSTISIDAGGVRISGKTTRLELSGSISIYDNYYKDGSISNVYIPKDASVTITGELSNPVGITSLTKPPNGSGDNGAVVVAKGDGYDIKLSDWYCFTSDEEQYKVTWDQTGNQILLEAPGNCDLSGLILSAENVTLSPTFHADETNYTATVGNEVDTVGITATLAGSTDGKTIKIKNGTVLSETDMTSGDEKEVPLAVGLNTIEITVTSGEDTKTYTIKITREAPVSYTYTITYDLDGGTAADNPESYTSSDGAITLNNPTKDGYTFTGWSGTGLDGENNMTVTIPKGSTGDREYTAHWEAKTYTVTLNGNEGTGTALTGYTYGIGASLPADWTKTGYDFAGWYDNENYTGTAATEISTTDTGDKTFWAKWTPQTYQVTFHSHGADGGDTTQSKTVTYDSTYGALPAPSRTGYAFKGWYTEENGQGSKVEETTVVKTAAAHTLHAYWKDEAAPDQPVLQDGVTLPAGWTNAQGTIPLRLYDGVGVTALLVSVDGNSYVEVSGFSGGTGSVNYDYAVQSGEHTYQFKAVDAAGNVSEESAVFKVKLDQVKPVIGTITYENKTANLWDWIIGKTSMIVHVPVTDAGSGVTEISYTMTPRDAAGNLDSSSAKTDTVTVSDGEAKITFAADFRGTIMINCTDATGNKADSVTIGADAGGVIVEDRAPDITTDVRTDYYDTAADIHVTVKDDIGNAISAGIDSITYQVGENGEEQPATVDKSTLQTAAQAAFTIPASEIPTGTTVIKITATDNAGNQAVKSITVKVKGPEKQPAAVIDYREEKLTGLIAGGEYLIDGNSYTADQEGCIQIEEGWFGITVSIVKKGNGSETTDSPAQSLPIPARPAAPNAPELSARDDKSITLQTITGAEYRLEGGAGSWQDSTVFEGLNEKTIYSFKAYYPATDTSFASAESDTARIATVPTAPAKEKLVIGFVAETLTLTDGIEAFSDQNCTTPVTAGSVEAYMGQTIYIRYPADGIIPESPTTAVPIPARPAKPTPGKTDASYPGAEDGAITGLTAGTAYEIRKQKEDGTWEEVWTPVTATADGEIDGLGKGIYEVRVQAVSGMNFHSEAAAVTIGEKSGVKVTFMANGEEYAVRFTRSGGNLTDIPAVPPKKDAGEQIYNREWCDAQGNPAVFTNITANMTVYAVYTLLYTVTLREGRGYTLSPLADSTSPVEEGGSFRFRFTLASGYQKTGSFAVKVNDSKVELSADETYTITDIRQNQTVTVEGVGKKPGGGASDPPESDDDPDDRPPTPSPSEPPADTPPTPPVNPPVKTTPPTPAPETTPPAADEEPEGRRPGTTPGRDESMEPEKEKAPDGSDTEEPEAGSADAGQTEKEPQAEKREVKIGNGTVIVTVVCEEEKCTAAVADTEAVVKAVLTPEQQELANGGETIEIRIDVTDISDQVPEQDKEVIENGIEAYKEEIPGLVLGMYVDISMFIRIGAGDWNAITATDEPIEVVIGIPERLQSGGREFYIIRAHEGEYAFMSDMDDSPDTITIKTNMFSSYAIAYVETEKTGADAGHKCGFCHICPTFLGICYFIWLAAALAVIFIVVFVALRRRKKEESDGQR